MLGSFTIKPFSKNETNFLKGVAILLIVFHNFFRAVSPVTGENEFWFSAQYIHNFFTAIASNPINFFNAFFNFLGHYGVQAFIVISAYGLTLSWNKNKPNYGQYLLSRFSKLYPVFFLAALLFIVVLVFKTGNLPSRNEFVDLGFQLSLFANFIPSKALVINGPWWFFSFIFQFYLVFPFIIRAVSKYGEKVLLAFALLGIVITALLYKPMRAADLNPFFLFIGHLPEFCLGIYWALKKEIRIPTWLILFFILVLIAGNIFKWFWLFANFSAAILIIVIMQFLIRKKHSFSVISEWLVSLGAISMYLFACHGLLRGNFIKFANTLNSPISSFIVAVIYFLFSIGVALVLMKTEAYSKSFILKPIKSGHKILRLFIILFIIFTFIGVLYIQSNSIASIIP